MQIGTVIRLIHMSNTFTADKLQALRELQLLIDKSCPCGEYLPENNELRQIGSIVAGEIVGLLPKMEDKS